MEEENKIWKVNYVIAVSTAILAFAALAGLILALAKFVGERTKSFGFGNVIWIILLVIIITFLLVRELRRWIKSG